MRIKIENSYSDGHESTNYVDIDDALVPATCEDDIIDFLYEYTGDGHGIDNDVESYYAVTVLESSRPELVGFFHEWC